MWCSCWNHNLTPISEASKKWPNQERDINDSEGQGSKQLEQLIRPGWRGLSSLSQRLLQARVEYSAIMSLHAQGCRGPDWCVLFQNSCSFAVINLLRKSGFHTSMAWKCIICKYKPESSEGIYEGSVVNKRFRLKKINTLRIIGKICWALSISVPLQADRTP